MPPKSLVGKNWKPMKYEKIARFLHSIEQLRNRLYTIDDYAELKRNIDGLASDHYYIKNIIKHNTSDIEKHQAASQIIVFLNTYWVNIIQKSENVQKLIATSKNNKGFLWLMRQKITSLFYKS